MIRTLRFSALAAAAILLGSAGFTQGLLTPPGAPAPTQRTLEELWQLVGQVEANNATLRAENLRQRRLLALLAPDRLAWQVETVRRFSGDLFTGEAFTHTALAFAPGGQPVVAYQNVANGPYLNLSRLQGGTWQPTSACSAQYVGRYTSLALAPDGRPAIACYDSAKQSLIYSRQTADFTWDWVRVDTAGDVGQHASLAFDPGDRPAIAYYDATNADLKLARYNGTTWSTETVASTGDVGSHARLRFFNGLPFIVCLNATSQTVVAFRSTGSGWIEEIVFFAPSSFSGLSFALDGSGQPSVLVAETGGQTIQHCTRSTFGSWSGSSLGGVAGTALSHMFGPDGQLTVAFRDYTTGALHYYHAGAPTGLVTQIVDASSATGVDYCSLAFGPDGQPAIAYYDRSAGCVKYAHRGVFTAQ